MGHSSWKCTSILNHGNKSACAHYHIWFCSFIVVVLGYGQYSENFCFICTLQLVFSESYVTFLLIFFLENFLRNISAKVPSSIPGHGWVFFPLFKIICERVFGYSGGSEVISG